jgi:uncharacterized RmlC-like cupin family protein
MRKVIVCLLVFLGFAALDLHAQRRGRATATFVVVVTDPAGTPVGGVLVTVQGAAARSARTEAGRIVFEGLPPGSYQLRFEREEYVTLERELTARAGAPTDVKVTLTPAPKPVAPPPPPPVAEPPTVDVKPTVMDLPSYIEKNYIGRGAGKTMPLACASSGNAALIQLNEPLAEQAHAKVDEFLYVVAGEGTVQMAGRQEKVHAGVLVLVPRGVPHTLAATGRNPLVVLSTRAGEGCTAQKP